MQTVRQNKVLLDLIRIHFVPYLLEKGFQQVDWDKMDSFSKHHFPLGHYRRVRNQVFEIINIQFNRYSRSQFVINFGTIPPEGIIFGNQQFTQEEAFAQDAFSYFGRLYQNKSFRVWFGPSFFTTFFSRQFNDADYVESLMKSFPEVETWFDKKEVGPHITVYAPTGPLTNNT